MSSISQFILWAEVIMCKTQPSSHIDGSEALTDPSDLDMSDAGISEDIASNARPAALPGAGHFCAGNFCLRGGSDRGEVGSGGS